MFILDTNVVSALRKPQTAPSSLVSWANAQDANQVYISVISIWEIEYGILLMALKDPTQAGILKTWFEKIVLPTYAGRTLSIDIAAARACASLHVPNKKPERDSLIGATAIAHGMTIVTRNEQDFEGMDCALFNPWKVV